MLRSKIETKLDPLGEVVNLSEKLFEKMNFLCLTKILIFVLGLTNVTNKTPTNIFLSFTVILNLGHTLDQLKIIQINLDLKAIAVSYLHNSYQSSYKIFKN